MDRARLMIPVDSHELLDVGVIGGLHDHTTSNLKIAIEPRMPVACERVSERVR